MHGCDVALRFSAYSFLRIAQVFIVMLALCQASFVSAAGPHDFTSDGCSLFPDGTVADRAKWCDCCFEHDIAYWRGGTQDERRAADARLKECVLDRTKNAALAEMMYLGVRAGGHPAFPTWYRWAYGWQYGRGYEPLTDEERRQTDERLAEYRRRHPAGYCGEHRLLREKKKDEQ